MCWWWVGAAAAGVIKQAVAGLALCSTTQGTSSLQGHTHLLWVQVQL